MTIWHICSACWTPKAKSTHSEYVTLIAVPLQQWWHERASMLRYSTWPVLFTLTTDHLDTRTDPVHDEKHSMIMNEVGLP
jgi:hypothetical protein